jgi:hypothetical protein
MLPNLGYFCAPPLAKGGGKVPPWRVAALGECRKASGENYDTRVAMVLNTQLREAALRSLRVLIIRV